MDTKLMRLGKTKKQLKKLKRRYGDLSVFTQREKRVAEYLTTKTYTIYSRITALLLISESSKRLNKDVIGMIKLFNQASRWAVNYILQGNISLLPQKNQKHKCKRKSVTERKNHAHKQSPGQRSGTFQISLSNKTAFEEDINVRVLRLLFVLDLAEELRLIRNFHIFFAIMGALNQPHLNWIWEFVREKSEA